jgi:isochorismate synthase
MSIKAGNMAHSIDISGFGPRQTFKNINLLHPTPAVCGLPKEDAAFIVENNIITDLFLYRLLGELNTSTVNGGSSWLYVNLHYYANEKNTAYLYIGCGITKDSDTDKEWEEV